MGMAIEKQIDLSGDEIKGLHSLLFLLNAIGRVQMEGCHA
jgi:hypothetical protein